MKKVSNDHLIESLHWRYAVKKFDSNNKISDSDWKTLEHSLILTPSSYGLQPWKFLVVQNPEVRKKLTPHSWNQTQVADCSHFVVFAAKGLKQTLLFFVPFLLYIIAEILPQEFAFKSSISKVVYSMAPVFGAVIGIYSINFFASVFGELISFMTGTLLYIVIRESLPSDRAEKPIYFIMGVLLYAFVIYFSWNSVY